MSVWLCLCIYFCLNNCLTTSVSSCPCIFYSIVLYSTVHRPFARRLPEFKFWLSCTKAVLISLLLSFFSIFDVPVFWPILVLYFFVLFYVTMKITHMIKHKYVPWSFGKATYSNAGRIGKDGK